MTISASNAHEMRSFYTMNHNNLKKMGVTEVDYFRITDQILNYMLFVLDKIDLMGRTSL
jgi:hypothetical protein